MSGTNAIAKIRDQKKRHVRRLIYYEIQDDNTELDLLPNSKNGFDVHLSL